MKVPNSDTDEQAIIGCCLLGGIDYALEAVEKCPASAFFNDACRSLFGMIETMATNSDKIGVMEVTARWAKVRPDAFPHEVLGKCLEQCVSPANLTYHIGVVVEAWQRRKLLEGCSLAIANAQDTTKDLEAIRTELAAVANDEGSEIERPFESPAATSKLIDDLQRRHELHGQLSGIATGFPQLDRLTDGLQLGELTVIAARPSRGKSSFGIEVLINACLRHSIPTLFVTLEMSVEAIMRRMLASYKGLDLMAIRKGTYTEKDFNDFASFNAFARTKPFWILDAISGMSIDRVSAHANRRCRKDGVKIVIVDYLQKIKPREKQEKRTYEVAEVSSGLKAIAVKNHCAVLALAQLNREPENGENGRAPRPSDLADSGQIERDADTIGLLHSETETKYALLISKQRDGPTGGVSLYFNQRSVRFQSMIQMEEP